MKYSKMGREANYKIDTNNIEEAVNSAIEIMPVVLGKLTSEMEILTGRKAKVELTTKAKLKTIGRKLIRMSNMVSEFKTLVALPLTTESASKAYQLLNSLLRLMIPKIPTGVEPVDHVINEIKKLNRIPSFDLPKGLDYETKHINLQNFINDIVDSVDLAALLNFLEGGFIEHQLVSQYQRLFNRAMLPKELQKYPHKITLQWVEKLKLALRDVTADWESLLNQLYGLLLLRQGDRPSWARIRRVSLWDKVTAVRGNQRLASLAKEDWVTIRNSLDHARAFFNPPQGTIEFPDRARTISLNPEQAFFEGVDIFLANLAMMATWNFVHLARLRSFEAQINALKQLAGDSYKEGKR